MSVGGKNLVSVGNILVSVGKNLVSGKKTWVFVIFAQRPGWPAQKNKRPTLNQNEGVKYGFPGRPR